MCGITGIVNFNQKPNKEVVQRMNNFLSHRGPDTSSIYENNYFVMAMSRLKIIDLSEKSNQPFYDNDKKIFITYNGEIYNFKDLKNRYFNNYNFRSDGDGEVLIPLYLKFGIDFISKIKGMFSIAISDLRLNKFYLIRDRFGIKPLYYNFDYKLNELSYSSEIESLFQNKKIIKEANYKEIFNYLNYSMVNSTNETWFKSIYQLESSHYLEFSQKNSIKINKYYSLENEIDEELDYSKNTFKYWSNKIEDKFSESFNQHTIFDVDGGIHLSGGADSAILASSANKYKKNLDTFTFDFEEKKYSEIESAKEIANSSGLNHFSSILKNEDVPDYLTKVLDIEHEPFSSLRILSQHHLYETFKKKPRVILDGSGGDEIGAGYTYHIAAWYLDILKERNINNPNKRLSKIIDKSKNNTIDNYQFLSGSLTNLFQFGKTTVDGSFFDKDGVIKKDFTKKFINHNLEINRPFKSFLRNAQYIDLKYLKLPRSLKYVDRASMRNSIETRVPFLDHELVEICFSIPSKFKILNNQQRIITKYPMKSYVDKKMLFKNKSTIADPQSYWLRTCLKNMVYDLFNSKNTLTVDIINNKDFLNKFDHLVNMPNKHINSFFIFQVLCTELWFNNILNK